MAELLSVDTDGFKAQLPQVQDHLAKFGEKLPQELADQLDGARSALGLGAARPTPGRVLTYPHGSVVNSALGVGDSRVYPLEPVRMKSRRLAQAGRRTNCQAQG